MITGLRHTGIAVSDLDKSLKFYCNHLGFIITSRREESGQHIDNMIGVKGAKVTTAKLSLHGEGMIELLDFSCPSYKAFIKRQLWYVGLTHIAVTTTNVEREYARLTMLGVKFTSVPQVSGNAMVVFCEDPDGNMIEIVEDLNIQEAA